MGFLIFSMLFIGAIFSRNSRLWGVALVAVLPAPRARAVRLGVWEKRPKVRHAHDTHRGATPVAENRRPRQRNVTAVTSAGHRNPISVESRLRRDPVE